MSSRGKRGKDDSRDDSSRKGKRSGRSRSPKGNKDDPTEVDDQDTGLQGSILPIIFGFGGFSGPQGEDAGDDADGWRPKGKIAALKDRIQKSGMDAKDKEQVLLRLKTSNEDRSKQLEWFEHLLRVPFGKYASMSVNQHSSTEELNTYFSKIQSSLDDAVYGMTEVKEEIMNYIAQFISNGDKGMPRVIGLCGAAGCGKTSLIRRGLSLALNRGMKSFSCGGLRDSAYLLGFEHCYSGSRYGRIAQSLMESEIMNPILFFDELDKISDTCDGRDIANVLIHLTDPSQNYEFNDKYFAGVRIDMSKVVFVFSYNDSSLIHPVLKDRIHEIKIAPFTEEEKVVIGTKYLLKEVGLNIGFKDGDIIIPDDVMRFMIKEYCKNDKGVRPLKRCIETILMKLNTARYYKQNKYKSISKEHIKLPYTLSETVVKELVKKKEDDSNLSYPSMYL